MDRARHYIEAVGAAHVFPCAGPPVLPRRPISSRSTTSIAIRPTSSPTRPCSSICSRRTASTAAHLIVPGSVDRARARDVQGRPHPGRRRSRRDRSTDKRAYLDEYRRDWRRPARRGAGVVGATAGRDLVGRARAWFEPLLVRAPITSAGIAGNVVIDVGDPDANVCIDFVESKVRAWKARRAVRLQGRRRPAPHRTLVERPRRGLGELAVPLVPVHRAPRRTVQRVRDDVLQGAVAGAHGLRRASATARARRRRPTSSSNATAGASSVGARTAKPISPASARSTTACSRAAFTTGASTSRPAAASRATTGISAASA